MSSQKIGRLEREIAKYDPKYEGPARGRARQGQFSHLNEEDRIIVLNFERELKLEKNKLAARNARYKKNKKAHEGGRCIRAARCSPLCHSHHLQSNRYTSQVRYARSLNYLRS